MTCWIRLGIAVGAAFAGRGASAQGLTTITHVNVVDVRAMALHGDQTVTVRDGRIIAISRGGQAPAGARVIDGRGKYLIPGLWDMHTHATRAGRHALPVFVANGVLGIRDMGGDFDSLTAWRREIARATVVGPRIVAAGPILEAPERVARIASLYPSDRTARTRVSVPDSTAAHRVIDSLARLGVDVVKFRTVVSLATYHGIAAAARAARLPLAGHSSVPVADMLRAGQRTIEHSIFKPLQSLPDDERAHVIRQLADARIAIVPTIVNYYEALLLSADRIQAGVEDTLARLDPRRRFVAPELLRFWREQIREDIRDRPDFLRRFLLRRSVKQVEQDLRELHRGGVRLLPGTDLAVTLIYPGFSLHDELRHFVRVIGMTPFQALASATHHAAEAAGLGDSVGTVEVGKQADLVLLDSDPTADIRNVARIHGVLLRGEYIDRSKLAVLLASTASRIQRSYGDAVAGSATLGFRESWDVWHSTRDEPHAKRPDTRFVEKNVALPSFRFTCQTRRRTLVFGMRALAGCDRMTRYATGPSGRSRGFIIVGAPTSLGLAATDGSTEPGCRLAPYTPETSRSRQVAAMELGIVLAKTVPDLANIEQRAPYFSAHTTAVVGYRDHGERQACGADDPAQWTELAFPVERFKQLGAGRVAQAILSHLRSASVEGVWVHFDVDVLDPSIMPAVDSPEPGGLGYGEVMDVIRAFRLSGLLAGMDVTIYDPTRDPRGSCASDLVACLAAVT